MNPEQGGAWHWTWLSMFCGPQLQQNPLRTLIIWHMFPHLSTVKISHWLPSIRATGSLCDTVVLIQYPVYVYSDKCYCANISSIAVYTHHCIPSDWVTWSCYHWSWRLVGSQSEKAHILSKMWVIWTMQREYVVVTEAISDEFTVSIFCMYNFTLFIKSHFYIMHNMCKQLQVTAHTSAVCVNLHPLCFCTTTCNMQCLPLLSATIAIAAIHIFTVSRGRDLCISK